MNNINMDKLLRKCIFEGNLDRLNEENNMKKFILLAKDLKELDINEPYEYLESLCDDAINDMVIIKNGISNLINCDYIELDMGYSYAPYNEPYNNFNLSISYTPVNEIYENNEIIDCEFGDMVYMEIKFSNILYEEIWKNFILPKLDKDIVLKLIDQTYILLNIPEEYKNKLEIRGLVNHVDEVYEYEELKNLKEGEYNFIPYFDC